MNCSWLKCKPIVLELDLARGLITAPVTNPLEGLKLRNAAALGVIRKNLALAAKDDRVRGLIVHLGTDELSPAIAEEVAASIADFAEHKPTIAWSESLGDPARCVFTYLLANACEEVWLQPTGQLDIGGIELGITLYRGTFEKFGIKPQFSKRKAYKTAADRYAADEVTPENREMMTALGQSLIEGFVDAIAERRNLDTQAVWDAVNSAPLSAKAAYEAGLIDQLGYRDQVYATAHSRWETKPEHQLFVHRYTPKFMTKIEQITQANQPGIGVVRVDGGIVCGRGQTNPLSATPMVGSDAICDQLRAAERNDSVKAVILRVNSPGGSYVASDAIWRAVHQVRESGKPVVAVMSAVAASGGYYVSMGADEIFAAAGTLTGSIGVVVGKLIIREALERFDLKHEAIEIGAQAGYLSPYREFSEAELAQLDQQLDDIYLDFTTKAANDRGLAYEQLEAVAGGRVWTGLDALRHGLVDHIGSMPDAIQRACELADLDPESAPVKMMTPTNFLAKLRPAMSSESPTAMQLGFNQEDLLTAVLRRAGLEVPGVLTMPGLQGLNGIHHLGK